jgi:non-heme chloroperoxidase
MPYLAAADGTQIAFADWGPREAPPIVFAHGWGLSGDMWNAQLAYLMDAGHRVVTYDRRGHGRSEVASDGYDLGTLADDLARLVEHLDLVGAVLVGHSMGAAEVVGAVHRLNLVRVAGLVLSAPSTPVLLKRADNPNGIDEQSFEAARTAMRQDIGEFLAPFTADRQFGVGHTVSATLSNWSVRRIVDTPLPVLLETQRTSSRVDLRDEIARIDLPALVLHGDADHSSPLELTGRPTAALLRRGRLVVFEGAGHGLYVSRAPEYNAELMAFVNEFQASNERLGA